LWFLTTLYQACNTQAITGMSNILLGKIGRNFPFFLQIDIPVIGVTAFVQSWKINIPKLASSFLEYSNNLRAFTKFQNFSRIWANLQA